MSGKTRSYLLYTAGEIALIVIGILVALQIENWNSDRQEEATLNSYLQNIARNLRDDVNELEKLQAMRSEAILLTSTVRLFLLGKPAYTMEELLYLAQTIRAMEATFYFNPNTSGFDALKDSGVLDRLQGRGVEKILSSYNDSIARVRQLEQIHNARLNSLLTLPIAIESRPLEGFENVIHNPAGLLQGRFEQLQPFYREYYSSAYPNKLFEMSAVTSLRMMLREYETLITLAQLYNRIIEADSQELDADASRTLGELARLEQGGGNPVVVQNGVVSFGQYVIGLAYESINGGEYVPSWSYFDHDSVRLVDDAIEISYNGGLPWAVVYFYVPESVGEYGRGSRDLSRFSKLILEAKGANGGETVLLNMKDKNDPDDGSQTNIEVTLSKDWHTYHFDLTQFENADTSTLNLVSSFLFMDQKKPVSFSIRTIKFAGGED